MKKILLATAAVLLLPVMASADSDNYRPIRDEIVKKECGACHLAFQPGLLPARSWKAIMGGLGDHFGEDASLDEKTARHISDYLVRNAGRDRRAGAPLRITELRWFVHEHKREVSAKARKRAGTMANCTACHRGADKGYYDDD
jgi:hypothetical protein